MGNYLKEVIAERYKRLVEAIENKKAEIGIERKITIVAVSKTHPVEAIINAIEVGITEIGENYAQEMKAKYEEIHQMGKKQPNWHFIGHLQTNKVKYIAPFVSLIHSVDSVHLGEEIEKQAAKHNRTIDVLIQVNTSGELSKFGCEPNDVYKIIEGIQQFPHISIKGLMTIGSFSTDEKVIRKEFRLLKQLFDEAKRLYPELPLTELSMGMTNDFLIAVEEGATILRIGTAIFGERHYS
ncbi:MAG: YggS family pyridoxal phosphate-dependent enzyme [Ignavibacteria bacterium]|nr:YggS family pyridoxal phosphate-dependent enzyme [Ignavibacteria bacterium]